LQLFAILQHLWNLPRLKVAFTAKPKMDMVAATWQRTRWRPEAAGKRIGLASWRSTLPKRASAPTGTRFWF